MIDKHPHLAHNRVAEAVDPYSNSYQYPNGGTIFDNSLVYCGGGLRTAHRNTNVPCLLTGGGFKGLKHGRHRMAPKENTPLANLWTTMLQDAGARIDRFADSKGPLAEMFG